MATLRNKRKLAAVSRETPESTRSGRAPNILDPELTQDYISQVSEEIEGRVTKKLSKEFSKTESRILGTLSKLDEFLLNPQVRTCSVVAQGTSRSNNLENQGTNEDRPSDDPGPEVEFSSPIPGAETNPHKYHFKPLVLSIWVGTTWMKCFSTPGLFLIFITPSKRFLGPIKFIKFQNFCRKNLRMSENVITRRPANSRIFSAFQIREEALKISNSNEKVSGK